MKETYVGKKILSLKYPEVTSYPFYANLFSILSNHEEALPWLYNHFLQLEINNSIHSATFLNFSVGWPLSPYKNCPWLYFHGLSREFIKSDWSSLTSFFIESINSGYYIYFEVDMYYISNYGFSYKKKHLPHDILIYGYDESLGLFHTADFFTHGKYSFSTTPFHEIEDGYIAFKSAMDQDWWLDGVVLLSFKDSGFYSFDIQLTIDLINDYLLSRNSNERFKLVDTRRSIDYVQGIEVYNLLIKHLDYVKNKKISIDIRGFYVLWDHKKIILSLIKYLAKSGYLNDYCAIYNDYKILENELHIIINLLIKYMVNHNNEIIFKAQNKLSELIVKETEILKKMLGNISILPKLPIAYNTTVKNSDFRIKYTGDWTNMKANNNTDFGTSFYTNQLNSSIEFDFWGTSINYIATKNKICGTVNVFIDDLKHLSISLNSESTIYNSNVLSITDLPLGYHRIRLLYVSTNCVDSSNNYITFDAFECFLIESTKKLDNKLKFIDVDQNTQGSWKSIYGNEGYDVIGASSILPSYAQLLYSGAKIFIWNSRNNDVRALQRPGSDEDRIGAYMCSVDSFDVEMIISGDTMRNVSLYLFEWRILEQKLQIDAIDADTGKIFDTQILSNISQGVYINYSIRGHVKFRFISLSTPYAVLSGVFWGKANST